MKSKQYSVYRIIPTAYAYDGLQSAMHYTCSNQSERYSGGALDLFERENLTSRYKWVP